MQGEGALADPAFTGAHCHEMTHPGQPVGDAGALLGNLLENSRPAIADDVMVALHFCRYGADSLQDRSLHLKIAEPEELSNGDYDRRCARTRALDRAVGAVLHLVHPARQGAGTYLVHMVEAARSLGHRAGHWWVETDSTRRRRCARGSLLISIRQTSRS